MKEDNEELVFDESEAIHFIWDFIPEEDRKGMDEDTIQYVLDVIYDYYESEGLMSDEDDDEGTASEADIDEEQMYEYVRKAAKKDKIEITDEQIQLILEGEFEYGVSIGIYEAE